MKRILYLLLVLLAPAYGHAQMLFSENLTMTIDSTKTLQGIITPSLNFQTEKEDVFTFRNTANFNILINKNRVLNLINKVEMSTYGKNVTLSGGYVHAEFRYLLDRAFEVYPYVESQWAGSRGMTLKYSSGLQSRYRLVNTPSTLLFATLGLFYEYEKWENTFQGVNVAPYVDSRLFKSHFSLSFKSKIGDNWELTTSAIHQGTPKTFLKAARFGGAVDLKYHITRHFGIRGTYRLIYDTAPIVNIRKDYNVVDAGLDISF